MKIKSTLRVSLIVIILNLFFQHKTFSQNWMVGVPVNMQLASLTRAGGSCYPTPDFNFNFPGSQVSGVDYVFIVTTVPANTVYINPGQDTIATGDTITLNPGNNNIAVFFFGGSGSVTFDFFAIGTPTTGGESHPCNMTPFWLSNLLLCNEGFSSTLNTTNCTVQFSTGIIEEENVSSDISVYPNPFSSELAVRSSEKIDEITIVDVLGKIISHSLSAPSSKVKLETSNLSPGIYFINVIVIGNSVTKKLLKQ